MSPVDKIVLLYVATILIVVLSDRPGRKSKRQVTPKHCEDAKRVCHAMLGMCFCTCPGCMGAPQGVKRNTDDAP